LYGVSTGNEDVTYFQLYGNSSNEEKKALEVFMRWLAQCHFVNQAQAFDVAINFPVYYYDEDFVLDSILRTPADSAPERREGFTCEVSLPSIDKLSKADPNDLMG
jgi:hypothetical protein